MLFDNDNERDDFFDETVALLINRYRIQKSFFLLDDRNEFEKSFFRFFATSLKFSENSIGSTLFYGLSNTTSESYAYYREG